MTARGKFILTLLVLGVVGFGVWRWQEKLRHSSPASSSSAQPGAPEAAAPAEWVETQTEVPALSAPAAYQPREGIVDLELSEYAGYAGIIAANGGLEPSTNSIFFQRHGFRVRIKLSEEESWPALNSGKMAGSATTVDVLAVYGKQFQVVVPAQIGFSRGADGVVVGKRIRRINDLKGKVLVTAQFTEAEFFIRYLAQEAGLSVQTLKDLKDTPTADALNLIFCKDAFAAGDLFLRELKAGGDRLAGCVTWAPKTTEVAQQSGGLAHVLTTSVNLLVIADILILNRGFAEQHTNLVQGLVEGLLEGNRRVRDRPEEQLDLIARAFKWTRDQARAELAKVHLSNLPETLAFFSGAIDAAGSFGGIYQSAVYSYGAPWIKDPVDAARFTSLAALQNLETSGAFRDQKIAIKPIRATSAAAVEGDPILSKDIRFLFEANSATLDLSKEDNLKNLEVINKLLRVSPGSVVLLRGHVDNSKVEEFRKTGGETYVRTMALRAVELSRNRSAEIKRLLVERNQIDPARLDIVGRGWEEATGTDGEKNRRVEVQWFMLE